MYLEEGKPIEICGLIDNVFVVYNHVYYYISDVSVVKVSCYNIRKSNLFRFFQ